MKKSSNKEKQEIVFWAEMLHRKNCLSGASGNISYGLAVDRLYITAHDSYLGFLKEEDILLVDAEGVVIEGAGSITSEKALHLGIHRAFSDARVVLHAHPPFTTAYFNRFDDIEYISFESKFYLGRVPVIPQDTPTVTELSPVLEALENNKIVVLKNHGVVAIGKDFKPAFSLIELLEQQCSVTLLTRNCGVSAAKETSAPSPAGAPGAFELFSEEHFQRLVDLVNNDSRAQELGKQYGLTTTLAIKNTSSGTVRCFHYRQGKITGVDALESAEFLISADEKIWRKIFNRQIDPFVAANQGIIKLRGDFNKMSAWFAVFERTFKLWEQAPVD